MTTKSTTFVNNGTFTPSPYLINGVVTFSIIGGSGELAQLGGTLKLPGGGAEVFGAVAMTISDTLTIVVGRQGGLIGGVGHSNGGNCGTISTGPAGGNGGGSTSISKGATLLAVAGGGGGSTIHFPGGSGGYPGEDGQAHGLPVAGKGAGAVTGGGRGLGPGGSNGTNGTDAPTGTGGNGGNASTGDGSGGGGGGGYAGGGGGGGGNTADSAGPGGGGSSFVDATVENPFLSGPGSASSSWLGDGFAVITQTYADPPLIPTLLTPASGQYLDAHALGVMFSWTYNRDVDSGAQNKYALRIKTATGAYQYWNATTVALQSGIVWNTLVGSFSATIPAAVLADAQTYNWSVATQEDHYNLQGTFAGDHIFTAVAQPTATITAPSGATGTSGPRVTWTEVLGSGLSQINYRVIVYTAAQVAAGGFVAGAGPFLYDSGVVASANLFHDVPSGTISNGTSCVAYVQINETGPVPSPWASSAFDVAFDRPATPVLVALATTDGTTGCPEISLGVVQNDNLLSAEDASFEGGTAGDWTTTGATPTVSTAWAADGDHSLQWITTIAPGGVFAERGGFGPGHPCAPGEVMQLFATVQQPIVATDLDLAATFFDASNVQIAQLFAASSIMASPAGVEMTGTVTAPAGAASVLVFVFWGGSPGIGKTTRMDAAGLFAAPTSDWSVGGYVGAVTCQAQRSVDGGVTWTDIRQSGTAIDATQQLTITDPEAPFGIPVGYRVRTVGTILNQPVTSLWSNVVTITLNADEPWLSVPELGAAAAMGLRLTGSSILSTVTDIEFDQHEEQGLFWPPGSDVAFLSRGAIRQEEFDLNVMFFTDEEKDDFVGIREQQRTVLIRDLKSRLRYVTMGADRPLQQANVPDAGDNPLWGVVMHFTPAPIP